MQCVLLPVVILFFVWYFKCLNFHKKDELNVMWKEESIHWGPISRSFSQLFIYRWNQYLSTSSVAIYLCRSIHHVWNYFFLVSLLVNLANMECGRGNVPEIFHYKSNYELLKTDHPSNTVIFVRLYNTYFVLVSLFYYIILWLCVISNLLFQIVLELVLFPSKSRNPCPVIHKNY